MHWRTPQFLFFVVVLALTCLALDNNASVAATPVTVDTEGTGSAEIPENLTREQVGDLVARLSDEEVRELLIQHLDKQAVDETTPEDEAGAFMDRLSYSIDFAVVRATEVFGSIHLLPVIPLQVWSALSEGSDATSLGVLLRVLLFFVVGVIVEQLFRRLLLNVNDMAPPGSPLSFKNKLRIGLIRAVSDVAGVIVFVVATLVTWAAIDLPTEAADVVFHSVLTGITMLRLVAVGLRFVLAPKLPWLRLVRLDDVTAQLAYRKITLVSGLLIFLIWFQGEITRGLDFSSAERGISGIFTSLIFIFILCFMIWQLRRRETTAGASATDDYLSRNWHVFTIMGVLFFYFLAVGVSFATGARVIQPFTVTLIVLGLIPVIDASVRGWAERFMREKADDHRTEAPTEDHADENEERTDQAIQLTQAAEPEHVAGGYEKVVVNNLRIVLGVVSILVIAEIWDLNLFGFLQALVGERAARILVNISITGLLAYALWGIVSTAVARIAGPEPAADGAHTGDEMGGAGGSRLGTVLPLFKKFLFITLMVMLIMIVLSSLGVDIGPLIAGAGILGIAIGFGAQTLVRDIVSGLFFLLDDAFRVGEYVTIGDTKGTVEKISVRSLRLRHHNGPLHTVPFGEIQTLTNWSRDWAIMKFEIRVPFETDVDVVRRIIKKVGIAMMEDEELGPLFLEPLKSQGVNRMDDSSFIIRCKFTSIPGQQFYIRREAYMRIQRAFEEKGIKFAPRRVIVETTGGEPADAKTAAAAAGALDAPNAPEDRGKDEPG